MDMDDDYKTDLFIFFFTKKKMLYGKRRERFITKANGLF